MERRTSKERDEWLESLSHHPKCWLTGSRLGWRGSSRSDAATNNLSRNHGGMQAAMSNEHAMALRGQRRRRCRRHHSPSRYGTSTPCKQIGCIPTTNRSQVFQADCHFHSSSRSSILLGSTMASEDTPVEGDAGTSFLLNQPVVIDAGTASLKAGFAGSSKPKVVIGTKVGRAKHMRIMPGGALEAEQSLSGPSSVFVGQKLDEHRGAFLLEYPMDKGHVVDGGWDAMESLWEHVYSKANLNVRAEDHPVLMTEAPLNPRQNRDKIAEIFFETFRAPALFLAPPAVLSLYASGRTTGVVLDVGEGVSHAVPVYEGFALPHSVTRSDVAGRDVTRQMQLLLRKSGLSFTTTAELDLVKRMKEESCYLTRTPITDDSAEKDARTPYTLPDGQTFNLSSERYQAPNVLFDPSIIGSEEAGVADILVNSIMKSDIDLRATLFSQIVLSGGSTLCPGFGDRLLHELRSRAPAHTKIRISAPPDRINSTFVGGSILASLATFKSMWVSRADYEEHGSAILHRDKL